VRAITLIVVSVILSLAVGGGASLLLRDIDRGTPVALIFEEEGPGAALGQGLKQTLLRIIDDCREQKIARYNPLLFSSVNLDDAVRQAAEAGAVAILGGGTSTFTGRLLLAAEKGRIACISPTANSERLALAGDRLYRVLGSTGARELARFAAQEGFSDYIVLADGENYQFVDSFLQDFVEVHGEAPLEVFHLSQGLNLDQVVKLLDSGLRFRGALILLPDFYSVLAVQLLRDFWPGLTIVLSDWGVSDQSARLMGASGQNVWGISFFAPEMEPHLEPLAQRLTERYGTRPPFEFLGPAHAALAMLDQAVKVSGTVKGGVASALSSMSRVDRWGWSFDVDRAGDGVHPLCVIQFLKGRWQTVEVLPPLTAGGSPCP